MPCFQHTYEELKLTVPVVASYVAESFQHTYEELKRHRLNQP